MFFFYVMHVEYALLVTFDDDLSYENPPFQTMEHEKHQFIGFSYEIALLCVACFQCVYFQLLLLHVIFMEFF